jgi:hypothetical protein
MAQWTPTGDVDQLAVPLFDFHYPLASVAVFLLQAHYGFYGCGLAGLTRRNAISFGMVIVVSACVGNVNVSTNRE